ncbi:hypothetical protein ABLO27_13810 [Roseibium sp. SCPC15]|uniref:hypothetical protein n=1 Tax=Roseibium sp. SCP15 TaxID=3141376 RepID=UPI00333819EF
MRRTREVFLATAFVLVAPANALADCAADISKVEFAIDHVNRSGIDTVTAEKMRALLEDANKERKAGNEAKCQELINQAKYMGNVE